jgi:hypothetical protein
MVSRLQSVPCHALDSFYVLLEAITSISIATKAELYVKFHKVVGLAICITK